MEFASVIARRRMTRRFDPARPVPQAQVERLIELAGRGPSAGFSQGLDLVVLTTPAECARFWEAATPAGEPGTERARWSAGVAAAPVLLLVLADEAAYRERYAAPDKGGLPPARQRWPIPYWLTDAAMGALLVLLGATDAGLGALFFGVAAERHEAVKDAFGIPADLAVVGVVAVGHEARRVGGSASRRPRRTPQQYAHWGSFGVAGPAARGGPGDNAAG